MATVSASLTLPLTAPRKPNSRIVLSHLKAQGLVLSTPFKHAGFRSIVQRSRKGGSFLRERRKLRSSEEETPIPQEEEQQQQAVSVSVSPSDTLRMFFQAEGTMSEDSIPKVTKALEGTEGISDLKVRVLEGIATVELTKETTVQSTGVASSLVELIQGSGFKLQTLNLSFEDEEDTVLV